jgi:hypothetical protein
MGGFITAPTNLASPSAIGSTTPNTGAFTTLSFAPANNTTGFSNTSNSLTGSNAQSLISLAQTWNTTGTPTAFKLSVTDTASNASSLLMDLQVNGVSMMNMSKGGTLTLYSGGAIFVNSGNSYLRGVQIGVGGIVGYQVTNTANLFFTVASTVEQRNGTNAQSYRLYRTYTDTSNYERLGFLTTNTTRYTITSQNAGTGSARSLELSAYTSSADPTSSDITSGCYSVWKNSTGGAVKLWYNDGGTMKSVTLA